MRSLLLAAIGALVACGGHSGSPFDQDAAANEGQEGGPCFADATCAGDLVCRDGLCQQDFPPVLDDGGAEAAPPCVGLKCQQVTCGGGTTTTVTGTVYAPNGTLPLYNVIVYVPNAALDPIPSGAVCDKCGSTVSGSPVVTTLTDYLGHFTLKDVPVGTNIPLVVQVGKWRRSFNIPTVQQCQNNPMPKNLLRLPKNRTEGSIPKIAVATGGCDPLACILPKIGLDAGEFGVSSNGPQKVTLYVGEYGSGPNGIQPAGNLWNSASEMKKFDVALFSCECDEFNQDKTNPAVVQQYLDSGGRLFGSHYHYTWHKNLIPAYQGTAQWGYSSGTQPYLVDTSFPKGKALADWMNGPEVAASTVYGQVLINESRQDVSAVNPPTTRWIYGGQTIHYLSFNTPVGKPVAQQCGKAVHAGMHIGSGGGDVDSSFPSSCTKNLSAQEKVLAFLLFDLSSCIQDETKDPTPPPPQ